MSPRITQAEVQVADVVGLPSVPTSVVTSQSKSVATPCQRAFVSVFEQRMPRPRIGYLLQGGVSGMVRELVAHPRPGLEVS